MAASGGQTAAGFNSDASNYQKLMWAISELEKVHVNKCDIRKPVNMNIQNRLVKLIGTKPIVCCQLEGKDTRVLLDTGSQVSMCDSTFLEECETVSDN